MADTMLNSPRSKAAAAIVLIAGVFFGLWKLEAYKSRFDSTIPSLAGTKSAPVKQIAAKKRKVYQGNPALDFEVQDIRVFGGRDDPSQSVARTYGYKNIIAPDRK